MCGDFRQINQIKAGGDAQRDHPMLQRISSQFALLMIFNADAVHQLIPAQGFKPGSTNWRCVRGDHFEVAVVTEGRMLREHQEKV
jgi:hypothetical protein